MMMNSSNSHSQNCCLVHSPVCDPYSRLAPDAWRLMAGPDNLKDLFCSLVDRLCFACGVPTTLFSPERRRRMCTACHESVMENDEGCWSCFDDDEMMISFPLVEVRTSCDVCVCDFNFVCLLWPQVRRVCAVIVFVSWKL